MGTVRYNVLDGELFSETRNGVRKVYIPDALGNTRALYDSTQTRTDTFDYFPSGTVAARTGTNPTPFQWNGGSGYFTDSSSRKYVRARNYHNNLARWNSQDPIGFQAGDFNLYRYCKNMFVIAMDPSGLGGGGSGSSGGTSVGVGSSSMHSGFVSPCTYSYHKNLGNKADLNDLVVVDVMPDIDAAVKAAKLALNAQYGKCAWKKIYDFVKKTLYISDSLDAFMEATDAMGCIGDVLGRGTHTCNLFPSVVARKDFYLYKCAVTKNESSAVCAYSNEGTAPNGPTTWCKASFTGNSGCTSIRTETAIHEAIHICSPPGFVNPDDDNDPNHKAITKLAHDIAKCK